MICWYHKSFRLFGVHGVQKQPLALMQCILVMLMLLDIRWTTWDSERFAAAKKFPFQMNTLSKYANPKTYLCQYTYK